jgi:hypothetical protein
MKALKTTCRSLAPVETPVGDRQERQEGTASDELARLHERENPWRVNPGRGCGVK